MVEGSQYWNVTLLRHGCLASTPDFISSVVSLRTIELYRRLRLRHPQLSVQAFVKVICDLHNVRLHKVVLSDVVDTCMAALVQSVAVARFYGYIRHLPQDPTACPGNGR